MLLQKGIQTASDITLANVSRCQTISVLFISVNAQRIVINKLIKFQTLSVL